MSDKIFELSKRIRNIEEELIDLKKEIRVLRTQSGVTKELTKDKMTQVEPIHKVEKQKEVKSLDKVVSEWLPRVFIFVFILGIIWAFVAAAEKGWINPGVRVMLGFVLTGILYWLGDRQFKKTQSALSIVLLGGSIVVYTVSIFAGNILYEIIPYVITLFLLGVGMFAAVWMSRKYHSQSLLAIIGIGAYFYPFIFVESGGSEYTFYLYETLVFIGLVLESVRKQYKVTWNIANYAFIFAVLFFLAFGNSEPTLITLLTLTTQQIFIIYLTFKVKNPVTKGMYIPAISTGAFFMYFIGEDIFNVEQNYLNIFYVAMAGLYFVLSVLKNKEHNELKNVFFIFSMFYLFVFLSELFVGKDIVIAIYALQSIVVYYISQKRSSVLGTVGSIIILMPVIAELLETSGSRLSYPILICWILVIGFFLVLYLNKIKSVVIKASTVKSIAPYIISLLTVILFGKISNFLTQESQYMFSDIGISLSWMIFVGVMYAAYSYFKDNRWNYIGLSFLIITLIKITFYDLATVDIVWRAILFIVLGAIGLFISRIFYNKKEN